MQPFPDPIYVTRPFLPPLGEFSAALQEIWDSRWLTNRGPIEIRLEKSLSKYLNAQNICLFNNGTLALQIALQGMEISGEVITTPFTFVATTHALFWNKVRPVFCDIEPNYYNIDPERIEDLITPWTTAILAVHVFGHVCQLDKLAKIAKKHNLRLIYDSAHAFGVKVNGKSVTAYGDLNMLSFHATKLFHTIEGGALVFQEDGLKSKFNYLKNFGFKNEVEVVMPGTNAKMTEFQALMGISILKYFDQMISKRKKISRLYRERLADVPGIIFFKKPPPEVEPNYAYVPVQIHEGEFGCSRDFLYEELKKYNVFTRRYFYPLVSEYACYKHVSLIDSLKNAQEVSNRILCLPIYSELSLEDVEKVCDLILYIQSNQRLT
jgi:dTDP-4-amino-4,6-dideoxygalactose transaminase